MVGPAGSSGTRAVEAKAGATPSSNVSVVPMIDLAAFMSEKLAGAWRMNFLKLDVEGMEYTLLPWLLGQSHGTLCKLHTFFIEWHLNFLPFNRRLEAFALERSFLSLLRLGCPDDRAPVEVWIENYPRNQFGQPIPGLLEAALMHAPWEGRVSYMAKARRDVASMAEQARATTRREAFSTCSKRRVACRTSATEFREDNCALDRISCDPRLTYNTYLRAVKNPINATGSGDCAAGLPSEPPPWVHKMIDQTG